MDLFDLERGCRDVNCNLSAQSYLTWSWRVTLDAHFRQKVTVTDCYSTLPSSETFRIGLKARMLRLCLTRARNLMITCFMYPIFDPHPTKIRFSIGVLLPSPPNIHTYTSGFRWTDAIQMLSIQSYETYRVHPPLICTSHNRRHSPHTLCVTRGF